MKRAREAAGEFMKELAAPARRALDGASLVTLEKIAKRSEAEVFGLHGMRPNAMEKLRAALKREGLQFSRR